jgi:hypothetical protein
MKFGNKKRHDRIAPESVEVTKLQKLIYTYHKPKINIAQRLKGWILA